MAVSGTALIYGRNPVREALRGRRRVHAVWLSPGAPGDELEQALRTWLAAGAGSVPYVRYASPIQLTTLAGSPDHQGIVAAVDPYVYVEPEAMLKDFTLLVALDEVQDPHNLGAIIRTAEGAGAGVVIPRHRAAEVTAAVVKASAGATEHAAIAQVRNLADFLVAAKEAGFWVYGAAAGAAGAYTAQDYSYPTCFVVGSEGQGLGRRVESLCDVMVSLPLQGKVDSLNVSVSTGILLYEAVRQRVAAGSGPWAAPRRPRRRSPAGGGGRIVTVYLIDGYNVLHQFVGHKQLPGGKHFRGAAIPGAGSRVPVGDTERDGTDSLFGPGRPDLEETRKRLVMTPSSKNTPMAGMGYMPLFPLKIPVLEWTRKQKHEFLNPFLRQKILARVQVSVWRQYMELSSSRMGTSMSKANWAKAQPSISICRLFSLILRK